MRPFERRLHRNGYCRHGKYVGGCGIDWMCGLCEDGITLRQEKDWALRRRPIWRIVLHGKPFDVKTFAEGAGFLRMVKDDPGLVAGLYLEKLIDHRGELYTAQTYRVGVSHGQALIYTV